VRRLSKKYVVSEVTFAHVITPLITGSSLVYPRNKLLKQYSHRSEKDSTFAANMNLAGNYVKNCGNSAKVLRDWHATEAPFSGFMIHRTQWAFRLSIIRYSRSSHLSPVKPCGQSLWHLPVTVSHVMPESQEHLLTHDGPHEPFSQGWLQEAPCRPALQRQVPVVTLHPTL